MTPAEGYSVAFDIMDHPLKGVGFAGIGVLLTVVGLWMVLFPGASERALPNGFRGPARRVFGWVFLLFSLAWTGIAGASTVGDYLTMRQAYEARTFTVTEGCIRKFHPMPAEGHDSERFEVNGTAFEYSDFRVTAGFNNTQSHGGPIHANARVRIFHVGNTIIRLEIARAPCAPSSRAEPEQPAVE